MGIDLETLIIIAVLAFILFGPEKLPEYAAPLGKFVAKMRQATTEMTRQYQDQNPFQYPPEPIPDTPASKRLERIQPQGQSASVEPETFCPYCQQLVTARFAFCPKCGHRLRDDDYVQPSQPAQPSEPAQPASSSETHQAAYPQIRPLRDEEIDRALAIINQAALAYQGVIPADCWHEPYMPEAELRAEIAAGVNFWGYETEGRLMGVIGRQDLHEVVLIRHAYIDPEAQRQGVGIESVNLSPRGNPGPRPGGYLGRGLVGHPLLRKTRFPAGHPDGEIPLAQHLLEHFTPPDGNLGGPGGPQVVCFRGSHRIIGRQSASKSSHG